VHTSQKFSVKQKGFAPILVLVGIFITVLAVATIYLTQSRNSQPTQTSVSSPIPSASPTTTNNSSWKIYTSEKFGYSIKYPESWTMTDETNSINKLDPETLEYINLNDPQRDNWANTVILIVFSQGIDKYVNQYKNASPNPDITRNQTVSSLNGIQIIKEETIHRQTGSDTSETYHIIIPLKEGTLGVYGQLQDKELIDQILSTFKFTDHNGSMELRTRPLCDFTGDGLCNAADLAIFQQALGKHLGEPGYNLFADVDGDGVITTTDKDILFKSQ
jgi:hypothetical protein